MVSWFSQIVDPALIDYVINVRVTPPIIQLSAREPTRLPACNVFLYFRLFTTPCQNKKAQLTQGLRATAVRV